MAMKPKSRARQAFQPNGDGQFVSFDLESRQLTASMMADVMPMGAMTTSVDSDTVRAAARSGRITGTLRGNYTIERRDILDAPNVISFSTTGNLRALGATATVQATGSLFSGGFIRPGTRQTGELTVGNDLGTVKVRINGSFAKLSGQNNPKVVANATIVRGSGTGALLGLTGSGKITITLTPGGQASDGQITLAVNLNGRV